MACSTQPCQDVTVWGPVREKPLTDTLSPGGVVANVTSTFFGSRSRVTVWVAPLRSVAVSWTSR